MSGRWEWRVRAVCVRRMWERLDPRAHFLFLVSTWTTE
jgi:hypothetical protein